VSPSVPSAVGAVRSRAWPPRRAFSTRARVARRLGGHVGQQQGQRVGVERLLGTGQQGDEQGQVALEIGDPEAIDQGIVIGHQPLGQALFVVHTEAAVAQVLEQQVDIEGQAVGAGDHALDEGIAHALVAVLVTGDQRMTGVGQALEQHGADVGRGHGREAVFEHELAAGRAESLLQGRLGSAGKQPDGAGQHQFAQLCR
jgi:hypothetical protein